MCAPDSDGKGETQHAQPDSRKWMQVFPPQVICERGVAIGQFHRGFVSVLCVGLEKAQSIVLELHRILGTTEIGLQGLDAFFQMSRRQMSISQGHSDIAVPSQCGNFC